MDQIKKTELLKKITKALEGNKVHISMDGDNIIIGSMLPIFTNSKGEHFYFDDEYYCFDIVSCEVVGLRLKVASQMNFNNHGRSEPYKTIIECKVELAKFIAKKYGYNMSLM